MRKGLITLVLLLGLSLFASSQGIEFKILDNPDCPIELTRVVVNDFAKAYELQFRNRSQATVNYIRFWLQCIGENNEVLSCGINEECYGFFKADASIYKSYTDDQQQYKRDDLFNRGQLIVVYVVEVRFEDQSKWEPEWDDIEAMMLELTGIDIKDNLEHATYVQKQNRTMAKMEALNEFFQAKVSEEFYAEFWVNSATQTPVDASVEGLALMIKIVVLNEDNVPVETFSSRVQGREVDAQCPDGYEPAILVWVSKKDSLSLEVTEAWIYYQEVRIWYAEVDPI